MKIRTVKCFGVHTKGVPCVILNDESRIVGGPCGAAPEALAVCEMAIKFAGHIAAGKPTPCTAAELYGAAKRAIALAEAQEEQKR